MKRGASIIATAVALMTSAPALADVDNVVTTEIATGLTVIGPNSRHLTGGFTLRGGADYAVHLSGQAQAAFGGGVAVFGMGGGPRAVGFFAGPTLRIVGQPFENRAWNIALTAAFDFGRFPQCNQWERPICARYVGFDPSVKPAVFYRSDAGFAVGGYALARIMPTPVAFTISGEFGLSMALTFTKK